MGIAPAAERVRQDQSREGDPDQPLTAGFACAKVNRDTELVHSPQRLASPLRRTGPKGKGQFAPIGWDEALDEIARRWKAIIAESGPLALLGSVATAFLSAGAIFIVMIAILF